jgi:hypothetical protein
VPGEANRHQNLQYERDIFQKDIMLAIEYRADLDIDVDVVRNANEVLL